MGTVNTEESILSKMTWLKLTHEMTPLPRQSLAKDTREARAWRANAHGMQSWLLFSVLSILQPLNTIFLILETILKDNSFCLLRYQLNQPHYNHYNPSKLT